jgi:hypothetical protein
MKVNEVSLYRNGISVISGEVDGKYIKVKLKHMNDVLKTIKIVDKKNNSKTNLTFPSPKSTTGDVKIDFDNPLLSILRSLKGERIRVVPKSDKKVGRCSCSCGIVMGIKEEKVFFECYKKAKLIKTRHKLILMTKPDESDKEEEEGEDDEDFDFDDDEYDDNNEEGCRDEDFVEESCKLKQFYLDELKTIELLKGSKKINNYLDVKNMSRSDAELRLKINGGVSPYKVFYAQSMAVWKVIYEVTIGEKSILTLYAVIDNNSSSNWKNIDLNLVSELPYSVEANLFSIIQLEKTRKRIRRMEPMRMMKRKDEVMFEEAQAEMEMEMEPEPTIVVKEAKVRDVGAIKGTFKQFETKATIDKNESSKVFLKPYEVKTEDWLYYNGTKPNPDMAVAVMVEEGFSMSGPLTVYKGGKYLGEEHVDVIKGKNEKNFFMYAKDLQTHVTRNRESNLVMIKVRSYSKLLLKIRRYFQQTSMYIIRCSRDSPVKVRVIHHPASNKFVSADEMKELGIEKNDILEIGKIEGDKTETKPADLIEIITNYWTQQTIDLQMHRSFVLFKTEFYYEDTEYNLLNRMLIISLFNMNLVFDSIKDAKPDLMKHAELIEKKRDLQKQIKDVESRSLLVKMSEEQFNLITEKKSKMENQLKEYEEEIKGLELKLKNIKLEKDSKIKVKNIKPYFVDSKK